MAEQGDSPFVITQDGDEFDIRLDGELYAYRSTLADAQAEAASLSKALKP